MIPPWIKLASDMMLLGLEAQRAVSAKRQLRSRLDHESPSTLRHRRT